MSTFPEAWALQSSWHQTFAGQEQNASILVPLLEAVRFLPANVVSSAGSRLTIDNGFGSCDIFRRPQDKTISSTFLAACLPACAPNGQESCHSFSAHLFYKASVEEFTHKVPRLSGGSGRAKWCRAFGSFRWWLCSWGLGQRYSLMKCLALGRRLKLLVPRWTLLGKKTSYSYYHFVQSVFYMFSICHHRSSAQLRLRDLGVGIISQRHAACASAWSSTCVPWPDKAWWSTDRWTQTPKTFNHDC